MTDRYENIRKALEMGPTPGPWEVVNETDVFTPLGARNAAGVEAAADDGWHIADCDTGPSYTEEGKEELRAREKEANAAMIAACYPDTIRALLDERDGLASENEALQAEVGALREMMEEREQSDEALLRQALEALESSDWYIGQLEWIVYSPDDTGTHEERAKVQSTITALRERLGENE